MVAAAFINQSFENAEGSAALITGVAVEPFTLLDGQVLNVAVDGVPESILFEEGSRSTILSANSETYALTNGWTLDVSVDGAASVTVTFLTADFVAIGAATAIEVVAVLIANLPGSAFAQVSGTAVLIGSQTQGTTSLIDVTGGTAAAAFGFPAGVAGVDYFVNIAAATADEVAARINAQTANFYGGATPAGALRLRSALVGGSACIEVVGGTASDAFDFPTGQACGLTIAGRAQGWGVTSLASLFEFAAFGDELETDLIFHPHMNSLVDRVSGVQGVDGGPDFLVANDSRDFDGAAEDLTWPSILDLTSEEVTFSAWVRPTALGASDIVFSIDWTAGSDALQFRIGGGGGSIQLIHVWTVTHTQRVTSAGINANEWTHIAATKRANDLGAGISIYINGVEGAYSTSTDGTGVPRDPDGDWRLGNTSLGTQGFPGEIRGARVWNRRLDVSEILELAAAFPYISPDPATAFEDFDVLGDEFALNPDNFTPGLFDAQYLEETFVWFGDATGLGAAVAAVFNSALTATAFEAFDQGWPGVPGSEADVLVLGALTAASFDVTLPEAVEDFDEEWSSNEDDVYAIPALTMMVVGQGGTAETFSPFTAVHTVVEIIQETDGNVYSTSINGQECGYVAQPGDDEAAVATELAACVDNLPQQVSAVANGAQVEITNDATNVVPFVVGATGTSPSEIDIVFTGVVNPADSWGGADANNCL